MVGLLSSEFLRFHLRMPYMDGDLEKSVVEPRLVEDSMNCLRCRGLMIAIQMKDVWSHHTVHGWRCLLCGETMDPGIAANRASHCPPVKSRARVPGSPVAGLGKVKL